jgi:hypothetical protein
MENWGTIEAPTAATSLTVTSTTSNSAFIWTAATDNVAVTGYDLCKRQT